MKIERNIKTAFLYLRRALFLRCPTCGVSLIFLPFLKTRSLKDWTTPLDGCPRCGYAYEREPGYFLLSIWALSYGFGSLLGLVLYLFLEWKYDLPLWQLLTFILVPVITFNILFIRHSKSIFLAVDHFFDPHIKEEGGGDGGNKRNEDAPKPLPTSPAKPLPSEKKMKEEVVLRK
ncbi:MAG: DUF983 domain-containing protein [Chthoniobacterales bacterium]